MAKQGDDAVADQAGGGVVARHDELEDRREQLSLVEPFVAVASEDQRAHQIVARRALFRVDERAQHGDDGVRRLLRSRVLGWRTGRAQQRDELAPERLPVSVVDAEELADHRERKREREGRHEIDASVRSPRGDAVEQIVHDRLDPR